MSDRLSIYLLTGQLTILFASVGIGFVMDKVMVWKALLFCHALLVLATSLFVAYTPNEDDVFSSMEPQPVGMTAGFIGMIIMSTILQGVNMALLNKAIQKFVESRGVLIGAQAFCMSSGVLFIDGVGARMYAADKRNPFYLSLGMESVTLLLICGLALSKKLRI